MQNELLAVVDDNDQIIEFKARSTIHAEHLRHRAVHILVFNRQQQILLQKRSMLKDSNRGLWDTSAAGHVDAGEEYHVSAPRELQEELGINVELKPLFKLSPTPALGMEFIQVYSTQHEGPFSIAEQEIDALAWFTLDEIDRRVISDDANLTETFRIIWRRFRNL
jgi:isopentenyldiphosphate isomerase